MLDHLRQHIIAILASARTATLASCGPADLQAQLVACAARDTLLYLLVPRMSDHLLNIEANPAVVVAATAWQVHGRARVLGPADRAGAPTPLDAPDAPWCVLVEVRPTRVTRAHSSGWGAAETIDLDDPAEACPAANGAR